MAAKLYSPVYIPGVSAKNPQKIYDTIAKCRIALLPLIVAFQSESQLAVYRESLCQQEQLFLEAGL